MIVWTHSSCTLAFQETERINDKETALRYLRAYVKAVLAEDKAQFYEELRIREGIAMNEAGKQHSHLVK